MNNSIIRQIFNGEKTYESIKSSEEEKRLLKEAIKYDDIICEKLSPELKSLYQDSIDAHKNLNLEIADNLYIEGFKIGILIGLEICDDY